MEAVGETLGAAISVDGDRSCRTRWRGLYSWNQKKPTG
jgi:hypothetical protein